MSISNSLHISMNESAERPKIPRQLTDKFTNLTEDNNNNNKVKAKVVPIIVGALGTVTRSLNSYLKEIEVNVTI